MEKEEENRKNQEANNQTSDANKLLNKEAKDVSGKPENFYQNTNNMISTAFPPLMMMGSMGKMFDTCGDNSSMDMGSMMKPFIMMNMLGNLF